MKAVIMAGGLGTRMGATGIPKPMLPVAGKPVLERQIECLVRFGITDITIVTHHLGEKIARHFGDGALEPTSHILKSALLWAPRAPFLR